MSLSKQVSLHGRRAYLTKGEKLVGRGGLASGGEGKTAIVLPSADTRAVFDDFFGIPIGDTGNFVSDSVWHQGNGDTGQVPNGLAASAPAVTNGVFRMTMSASATQAPATTVRVLNHALSWKVDQGKLRIAARVKFTPLAGNQLFVGFTDTLAGEMPAYDTGGGVISPATDAIGWLFGQENQGTAAVWQGVAVKTDVDSLLTTTVRPTVNTYDELELSIDNAPGAAASACVATFYLNGKPMGTITAPVAPTVALTPVVAFATTDAQASVLDIDWINVSAQTDTGT